MNRNTLFEHLLVNSDLPGEASPGTPLVEIFGDSRVLIENHCAIVMYCCTEIRVKVKFGQICVHGCNLSLAHMTKQQLVIVGNIQDVSIIRG